MSIDGGGFLFSYFNSTSYAGNISSPFLNLNEGVSGLGEDTIQFSSFADQKEMIEGHDTLKKLSYDITAVGVEDVDNSVINSFKDQIDALNVTIGSEEFDQEDSLVVSAKEELNTLSQTLSSLQIKGDDLTDAEKSQLISDLNDTKEVVVQSLDNANTLLAEYGTTLGGEVVSGSDDSLSFFVKEGQVIIEAENFHQHVRGQRSFSDDDYDWRTKNDSDASGGQVVKAARRNKGDNTKDDLIGARLDYNVHFEEAGTYYVWAKIDDRGSGGNNSVHVGLNGEAGSLGGNGLQSSGQETGFEWADSINMGRVTIEVAEAGNHTFNMWMREDGTKVDQLIITQDENFSPVIEEEYQESNRFDSDLIMENPEFAAILNATQLDEVQMDLQVLEDRLATVNSTGDVEALGREIYNRLQNVVRTVAEVSVDDPFYDELQEISANMSAKMDKIAVNIDLSIKTDAEKHVELQKVGENLSDLASRFDQTIRRDALALKGINQTFSKKPTEASTLHEQFLKRLNEKIKADPSSKDSLRSFAEAIRESVRDVMTGIQGVQNNLDSDLAFIQQWGDRINKIELDKSPFLVNQLDKQQQIRAEEVAYKIRNSNAIGDVLKGF